MTPVTGTPAPAAGKAVALRSVGTLGQILVGPKGTTLYLFLGDMSATSTCNGSCATSWPPFTTAGQPHALAGVMQSLLETTKRADGTMQVTYNGHPLYYFVGDSGPGTATGEGVNAYGALWEAVNAAGAAVTK